MIIDCAFDEKLSDELMQYLSEKGFTASNEDCRITVDDPKTFRRGVGIILEKN